MHFLDRYTTASASECTTCITKVQLLYPHLHRTAKCGRKQDDCKNIQFHPKKLAQRSQKIQLSKKVDLWTDGQEIELGKNESK